ncbi:MAG TPA: phospholipase D-like domain-containing protein, partial [Candidatus Elarobacter sp.]|nr:phospholipase D-like domain-containing protein [Candidatus Elarobacter sp.]
TDVQHNFVQRWNEASERDRPDGAWPDAERAGRLPFPAALSPPAGTATVQITRTVRGGRYRDPTAAPDAPPFPIEGGERSVLEQYLAAVAAARRTVYLENQFLHAPEVLAGLEAALARGVEVVFVVPAVPMPEIGAARRDPRAAALFAQLETLGRHPRFTLAGLAASLSGGRYQDVYVHAKAALVDDAWATIGSTNVASRSFYADTELNASLWDPGTARALRSAAPPRAPGRRHRRLRRRRGARPLPRRRGREPRPARARRAPAGPGLRTRPRALRGQTRRVTETSVHGSGGTVSASIRRRWTWVRERPTRAAPHRRSDGAPAPVLRRAGPRAPAAGGPRAS